MNKKIKKVYDNDTIHKVLMAYINKNRLRLDVDGVIGESGAYKTQDFIWINGKEEVEKIAIEMISYPSRYGMVCMPHDDGINNVFVIKGTIYLKCMISTGYLWVDIHA